MGTNCHTGAPSDHQEHFHALPVVKYQHRLPKGCGVSSLGDLQKDPGHGSGHSAVSGPAGTGFEPEGPRWPCQTQPSCDSINSIFPLKITPENTHAGYGGGGERNQHHKQRTFGKPAAGIFFSSLHPYFHFPFLHSPLSKNRPPRNFSTEEQVCSQRQPALSKHTHTLLLPEGNLHKTPHFVLGSKGLLLQRVNPQ